MRSIFASAAFFVVAGLSTAGPSPAEAAVFSVGAPSGSFVNEDVCMDVEGNTLGTPGGQPVPVIAFNCHAGPNQQFQFAGTNIYAMAGQRCVGVEVLEHINLVVSYPCGTPGLVEAFYYTNGMLLTVEPLPGPPPTGGVAQCLDAGNLQNGTQLVIAQCDGSNSQQWQIK